MSAPKACVLGHPIAHSRSPLLHAYWRKTLGIAGSYEPVDVAPADLPDFLRHLRERGYVGANVTVPHKAAALATVDTRDTEAEAIGAVNTVWYEGDRLAGGNTDAYGFLAHLDATLPGWEAGTRRALVLGAGGAGRAVTHALLGRVDTVDLVNRTAARAQDIAARFGPRAAARDFTDLPRLLSTADILINTTSLGMAGHAPLDLDVSLLRPGAIVYDIVYVPLETALLRAAKARGHRIVDGLGMLLHQAVPGFARWFGVTPPVTPELRALLEADIRAKSA
jgi:shikimate dehydrogenase